MGRWLIFAAVAGIAVVTALAGCRAPVDPATAAKQEALPAVQAWLEEIDSGDYAPSWDDASASFKTAVTSDQWVAAMNSVRVPLGKLVTRQEAAAQYQTSIPQGPGRSLKGQFVIAQFGTSFENLKSAVETVTFEKEADGTWRASGYYIKPGP
jgi:hypothetical protein